MAKRRSSKSRKGSDKRKSRVLVVRAGPGPRFGPRRRPPPPRRRPPFRRRPPPHTVFACNIM